VRWVAINDFAANLFGETIYQISSESPEFYTRHYKNIMTSVFWTECMTQLEASVCLPLQVAETKQQHDEANGWRHCDNDEYWRTYNSRSTSPALTYMQHTTQHIH